GIASFLLEHLISIAETRGVEVMTANVLYENSKMIKVFKRNPRKHTISVEDGVIVFRYNLKDDLNNV
nr:hypothetical protein [Spirochaetota bacterium]